MKVLIGALSTRRRPLLEPSPGTMKTLRKFVDTCIVARLLLELGNDLLQLPDPVILVPDPVILLLERLLQLHVIVSKHGLGPHQGLGRLGGLHWRPGTRDIVSVMKNRAPQIIYRYYTILKLGCFSSNLETFTNWLFG